MKYSNIIITLLLIGMTTSCSKKSSDIKQNEIIYVRHAGADMPAYIYGNIVPKVFIIVLHGGPGGNGLEYRSGQFSEQLEKKYAMVYFDQRGQGMSQGHYSNNKNRPEEMAHDVRALALVLKKKYGKDISVFLMGHSWGGTLGSKVMITSNYQNEFKGWIEVDGAHDLPLLYRSSLRRFDSVGSEQIALGNNINFWNDLIARTRKLDSTKIAFGQVNEDAGLGEGKLEEDGIISKSDETNSLVLTNNYLFGYNILTNGITNATTANRILKNGLENYSTTAELHKIQIPSLIMSGKYDLIVPQELAFDAFSKIGSPNKKLVIFDFSGHSPMSTEPVLFNQEVINFVEQWK